jgi:hypothetical protein
MTSRDKRNALRLEGYTLLLVLLLVFLVIQSSDSWGGVIGAMSVFCRVVIGIVVLVVVFEHPRQRFTMGAVILAAIVMAFGYPFVPPGIGRGMEIAFHGLVAVFVSFALVTILRRLLRRRSAGGADVLGAICGYLLAGDALAAINAVTYLLAPGAFSVSPDVGALLTDLHGRTALFVYYSFSQLLTLGYSDVTPVRAPATTLSLFAALFGLFYTAIVVAQFVGLEQGPPKDESEKS